MVNPEASLPFVRLLNVPGVGWGRIRRLLEWSDQHNMRIDEVVEDIAALRQTLTEPQVEAVRGSTQAAQRVLDGLVERDVSLIAVTDERYPERINTLLGVKAPPLLAVLGNQELLTAVSVGFCGSRKASEKGLGTARDCAEQLAAAGVNVVSGYAAGVDVTTHTSALRQGGSTTVVLAEGILNFRVRRDLQDCWDWNRVVVVSEFMPTVKWNVGNAMQRNSTICALSRAMVLIEAGLQGGSIEAGRTCLNMGLPLFAPVYDGMPQSARGNQEMLEVGARPLLKSRVAGRANVASILTTLADPCSDPWELGKPTHKVAPQLHLGV
jgi:DNA protecting protein DprA